MRYKASWFLVIIFPIILFFLLSYKTIKEINSYFSLNTQTRATIESFDVINKKENFKPLIYYSFKVKDKIYKNKNITRKKFLNNMNVKEYVDKLSHANFTIWYNKKNPNISSFERDFPIKNCVYLSLTFLIFVYFLILKYYVYGFQKND
jgi:hypothetical protein